RLAPYACVMHVDVSSGLASLGGDLAWPSPQGAQADVDGPALCYKSPLALLKNAWQILESNCRARNPSGKNYGRFCRALHVNACYKTDEFRRPNFGPCWRSKVSYFYGPIAKRSGRALTGPHRHNWLNADGQGVDARRHVAFRSGSPKSLRAPRAVVTRFLAHARFQTAPTSLLTLQTCGGGLRLGRVKMMNSRTGTAACIGRAGPLSPTSTGGPRACYRRRGKLSDGGSSLSTLAGTASSASALEGEDSSAALDVTNFFSHPTHPWVCYWKLVELGALLDSFELEMDY
ncbi:hypothetical protein THAOC_28144, partial [Thalassiosira oceanica]